MKTLQCFHTHAEYVEDVIAEFNDRWEEFGLTSENDLVSVSVLPVVTPIKVHHPKKGAVDSVFEVVFVFWSTHPKH